MKLERQKTWRKESKGIESGNNEKGKEDNRMSEGKSEEEVEDE